MVDIMSVSFLDMFLLYNMDYIRLEDNPRKIKVFKHHLKDKVVYEKTKQAVCLGS